MKHSNRKCFVAATAVALVAGAASTVSTAEEAKATRPWTRHTIDNTSRGADGVRLADANGDGLLDIATGWEEGGLVRVYINPGPKKAKQPWPHVTVGRVKSPEDAVLVDLDGDGALDVVTCCEGRTRAIYVHWAPKARGKYLEPEAWKTEPIPAAAGRLWMFALPLQVDGRRGVDIVVGAKGGGAIIGWLESPADPRRLADWKLHTLRPASWIMSLQAHDMDGDGDQDILASDRKGKLAAVLWLENPGAKAAYAGAKWKEHTLGRPGEAMFLARGDLDGDKTPDIACAVKGRGLVIYCSKPRPKPNPYKTANVALTKSFGTAKAAAIGDLDGDGRRELVFSCENAHGEKSGLGYFRWRGDLWAPERVTWKIHDLGGPQGVKFDRMELVDLDGDGDLDVLTCEERDQLGVVWCENPAK